MKKRSQKDINRDKTEKRRLYLKEFAFWCRCAVRWLRVESFKCKTKKQKDKQKRLLLLLGITTRTSECQMQIISSKPIRHHESEPGGTIIEPNFTI